LHLEDVRQLPLEGTRPYVVPIVGADQLRRHHELIALFADAALHHVSHMQLVADLVCVSRLALEEKCRRRSQPRDARCAHPVESPDDEVAHPGFVRQARA
jgi:hypothetical protein